MSRMFGTDGVRGVANTELTPELAFKLGRAGAYVLTEGTHKPKILVGMDTRISGQMLECALVSGILSVGAEAVCIGIVPTPAIAYLTRKYNADAGVMISASHNPVEYNGIKFFDSKGYKLKDEIEDRIQYVIENNLEEVPSPVSGDVGRKIEDETAVEQYVKYIKSAVDVKLDGLKIALDCANGAAYKAAVKAFRDLKAEVYVINDNPDGVNINKKCGSTHMEELMDYVVKKGCDLGLAFDGDADRCLAVDNEGNLVDGDKIMAVFAKYLKSKGKLVENTLVTTVMSNMGLFLGLDKEEINTVKTKVGDRYVLEELIKRGYNLGGEQSGHIIFLDYNSTGDGLLTAVKLCEIVKESNKTLKELSNIVTALPQVLENAVIPNDKKDIYLVDEEIVSEINKIEEILDGKGRVLIRPSGTEPLVRVMLEGEDQEEINSLAKALAKLIYEKANN